MSLPSRQRIKRPAEFRRVLARGKRSSSELTSVVAKSNDLTYVRVGLSVSKRVGNAVKRNRVKRRIRNAFANLSVVGGWDFVATAKPHSSAASYAELERAIHRSVEQIGIDVATPKAAPDSKVVM